MSCNAETDLVILNLAMPKMNGLQAARTIHTAAPKMPMLLFTLVEVGEALAQQARDVGFQGALSKEAGVFALSQVVEALLQGKTFFLSAPMTPEALASDAKEETIMSALLGHDTAPLTAFPSRFVRSPGCTG
ncbi:MAG: response regulator [Candidatus Acidiferrales bacterium]